MSVKPSSPEEQYNTVFDALQKGKRIGYNKAENKFEVLTSKMGAALKKQKSTTIESDLDILKGKIEDLIKELPYMDKVVLKAAFNTRATELEGRIILFGRGKRDKAVEQLKDIAKSILPTLENSDKISSDFAPITTENFLSMGERTTTHKNVTYELDKLRKFDKEPKHPWINPSHDLGKPLEIPPKERKAYVLEIETYVTGTGGLRPTLNNLKAIIAEHEKDLEQLMQLKNSESRESSK